MIDHMTFGVTDFARSVYFYDHAILPLGVVRLFDVPRAHTEGVKVTGYGDDRRRGCDVWQVAYRAAGQ